MLLGMSLAIINVASDPFGTNVQITSNLKSQDNVALAIDGTGGSAYIYMAWSDLRDDASASSANIYFARSDNGGLTWNPDVRIDGAPGATDGWKDNPDMAIGADGTLYIVWDDTRSSQSQIFFTKSVDNGASFSTPVHIGTDDREFDPAITVIGSGGTADVYVAFRGQATQGILGVHSSNGGTSFGAETPIISGGVPNEQQTMKYPDMANDGAFAYCVWANPTNYGNLDNIFCARTAVGGLTWSSPTPVTSLNVANQRHPVVACGSGEVHVAYQDYQNDDNGDEDFPGAAVDNADIYYCTSSNQGSSFSAGIMVNDDGGTANQYTPSMAIQSDGTAVIAWSDYRNGNDDPDIFYATGTTSGFGANNRANEFTVSVAEQFNPAIALEGDNTAWCAWSDTRNGNDDLYIATTMTNEAPPDPTTKTITSLSSYHFDLPYYINTESDFEKYTLHSSLTSGFTPDGTNTVNETTNQATEILGAWGLTPGKRYYYVLGVHDRDGLSGYSTEGHVDIPAINVPPFLSAFIPNGTLEFDEDSSGGFKLLNLSNYFDDDFFKGGGLKFEIHKKDSSKISAEIVNETWVTFASQEKDWNGVGLFWAKCFDGGMDGIHNLDDEWVWSNNFTVEVAPTNDPPALTKLYPPGSSAVNIQHASSYTLQAELDQASEDTEYTFKVEAYDVDEDDITFACNDTSVSIEADPDAPTTRKIFKFTPDNDDVLAGFRYFNITATDTYDTEYIHLKVKVRGVNDYPYFVKYVKDGSDVDISPKPTWTLTEREYLKFVVYADDIDGGDTLFFSYTMSVSVSGGDPVTVTPGPEPYSWNVSIYGDPELMTSAVTGSFDLTIGVSDPTSPEQTTVIGINLVNLNDDPEKLRIEVDYTLDALKNEISGDNLNDNEELVFTGFAFDPDGDDMTYTWDFGDGSAEESGRVVYHTYSTNITYQVTLTVSDGKGGENETILNLSITSDGDYDNDTLPDEWELQWFENLDDGKDDDHGDGIPNWREYELGTNPTDKKNGGGGNNGGGTNPIDPEDNPYIALVAVGGVVLFFILIIVVVIIIINIMAKIKEDKEEKEIEAMAKEAEERAANINNIYGVQVAGAEVESTSDTPTGSALDNLTEEEKMFIGGAQAQDAQVDNGGGPQLVSMGDQPGDGPAFASGSGPVFDSSAPKLELQSEGIKLETVEKDPDDDMVIETTGDGPQLVSAGQDNAPGVDTPPPKPPAPPPQ